MNKLTSAFTLIIGLLCLTSCNKSKDEPIPDKNVEIDGVQPAPSNTEFVSAKSILNFKDDANSNEGISRFKKEILSALEKGDQETVLNAFSGALEFDSGMSGGKKGVIELWELDGSKEKLEPLKAILKRLLSNGGCLEKNQRDSSFIMPYYLCIPLEVSAKCTEGGCGVINRNGADLFESPSAGLSAIYHFEPFEIVHSKSDTLCEKGFTSCSWTSVKTYEGKTGFVPKEKIDASSDGLIWLVKEAGGWKIRELRAEGIPSNEN